MAPPRTEPPSPRRLADALSAGMRPVSHDLSTWLSLALLSLALVLGARDALATFQQWLLSSIATAAAPTPTYAQTWQPIPDVVAPVLWLFGLLWLGALTADLIQGGGRLRSRASRRGRDWAPEPLALMRTSWMAVKAVVLIATFLSVWFASNRAILASSTADLNDAQRIMLAVVRTLSTRGGVVLGLMVVADLIVARMLWRRSLWMTRDELRRELRETSGDPAMSDARRQRHRHGT